jgi:hypothetical protein
MEKGEIVYELPNLEKIRERALEGLSKLPEKYKRLKNSPSYPVKQSRGLKKMVHELTRKLKKAEHLG